MAGAIATRISADAMSATTIGTPQLMRPTERLILVMT